MDSTAGTGERYDYIIVGGGTSGDTVSTLVMIAERAADMIREAA